MNYWWVNQGGSHAVSHAGSYMWSPMREKDGARNQAYENMKEVAPGDLIFCHFDSNIAALGTAKSYCYSFQRPEEFHDQNRGNEQGWKIDVEYKSGIKKLYVKPHYSELLPLLPKKYSPLAKDGQAAMKLYLTKVSPELADKLMALLEITQNDFPEIMVTDFPVKNVQGLDEKRALDELEKDKSIPETMRISLCSSRIGQGTFRDRLCEIENKCRITGISNKSFLIASHIKPWKDSNNEERLDGHNGFLLSPNIDRLFDRNFISFCDAGKLLVSPLLSNDELKQFGLQEGVFIGSLSVRQRKYLEFHRSRLKKSSN